MRLLKRSLTVLGVLLLAFGTIWFFQGIGVLPGSFMSGQTRWAVIGAITAAVGAALMTALRRMR